MRHTQYDHTSSQRPKDSPFFCPFGVVLTNATTPSLAAFSLVFFSPAGVLVVAVVTALAAFAASLASFSSRLASFLAR
jgi:hypothetical protein